MNKLLSGRCADWPACGCGKRLPYWDEVTDRALAEPGPIAADVFNAAHVGTFLMLSCMSINCPDRRARQHATIQLLHPIYQQLKDPRRWPA
jgi:hypothetical protein